MIRFIVGRIVMDEAQFEKDKAKLMAYASDQGWSHEYLKKMARVIAAGACRREFSRNKRHDFGGDVWP